MLRTSSARISIFLHILLFFIVAASALNYWSVAEYAIHGNWQPEYYKEASYISLIPGWQKVLKDGFAMLLLVGSLCFPSTVPNLGHRENQGLTICYGLCLVIFGIAIARSIASDFSLVAIFACARPFLFVVAIFVFCHRHLNSYYLRWVLEAMNALALVQVFYTFLQRQTAVMQNGVIWLSSGAVRSVGTFIEPNTLGLFLALVFYLNLSILPPHKLRNFILPLLAAAIYLTGSRTALIIIIILWLKAFLEKTFYSLSKVSIFQDKNFNFFIFLPLLLTSFFLITLQVNQVSGRASGNSLNDGRLGIFQSFINQGDTLTLLFGKHFGFGSNIIQTLSDKGDSSHSYFLADSTFTAVLSQFGIVGILVISSVIYMIWQNSSNILYTANPLLALKFQNLLGEDKAGFWIYLLSTLATIIIFEFYAVLPIVISLLFLFGQPKIRYECQIL